MDAAGAVREGLATLRAALATRDLRRLQVSWMATSVGNWAFFVLLAIYAFERGGATGVGLAALARMLPAGLAAPFTSMLADRRSRRNLLVGATLVRGLALAATTAAVAAGAPLALVLVLAAVQTVAATAVTPAQAALLPLLARTPQQLAAANAAWSAIDSAGFLAGALLGGWLAAGPGLTAGFAADAVAFLLATLPQLRLPRDDPPPHRAARADERWSAEVLSGFRAVGADHRLRLLIGALAVTTLIEGAIDVLVVVVALDVLHTGSAGVGWLNAAWGFGGLLGGAAAVALLGGGRLASALGGGSLVVAAALAGVAGWSAVVPVLLLLVVLGIGYALIEVAGLTLTQRLASDDVLGRVFGVVESTYVITTAVGSALAPVAVTTVGTDGALLLAGAVMVAVTLVAGPSLARLEASVPVPEREFRLLRSLSVFAPLPIATVETLAARLEAMRVGPGDVVVREGDPGDRCYVVAEGHVTLANRAGWSGEMGPGGFFGELALLRDAPRNATVRAAGPGLLLTLDREAFLAAVTGHARTREAADALMTERLRESERGLSGAGRTTG